MKSQKSFKEVLKEFQNDQGLFNLLEDIQKIVTKNNKQMDVGETLYVASRQDFRKWLTKFHKEKKEIWLIFYKRSSGKPTIPYDDAVEEALCYGWIDSQQKPIDKEKLARRFAPRHKQSGWSEYNKARALKMLQEGKMTKVGVAFLPTEVLKKWGKQR